jgi:hypothetical protein
VFRRAPSTGAGSKDGRAVGGPRDSPALLHPTAPYLAETRCCASQAWITEMDASSPIHMLSYKGVRPMERVPTDWLPMVTRRACQPRNQAKAHRGTERNAGGSRSVARDVRTTKRTEKREHTGALHYTGGILRWIYKVLEIATVPASPQPPVGLLWRTVSSRVAASPTLTWTRTRASFAALGGGV